MNRRAMIAGLAAASCALMAPRTTRAAPDLTAVSPEARARMAERHARILAAFPYETTTIDGKAALVEWQRLKDLGKGWPIIVGSHDDLLRIADQFSTDDVAVNPYLATREPGSAPLRSPADILAAAEALEFPKDFYAWPGAFQNEELTAPDGEWPIAPAPLPKEYFPSIAVDMLSGNLAERVNVVFLPLRQSWEAPAYLRWGDWNACPPPEYHAAAMRRWDMQFGLEVVAMGPDRIDLRIANPPRNHDLLLQTTREIYRYCPDIVDQGAGSLSALAATMVAGSFWTLWWD